MNNKHTERWFIHRIGKIIYRTPSLGLEDYGAICPQDLDHAKYLFLSQNELNLTYYE